MARAGAWAGPSLMASLLTMLAYPLLRVPWPVSVQPCTGLAQYRTDQHCFGWRSTGSQTKTPRWLGAGSGFDLRVVAVYLHKPDSRAWLDGNKDEYEYESYDYEIYKYEIWRGNPAHGRHVGRHGRKRLLRSIALRHVRQKTTVTATLSTVSFGTVSRIAWATAMISA